MGHLLQSHQAGDAACLLCMLVLRHRHGVTFAIPTAIELPKLVAPCTAFTRSKILSLTSQITDKTDLTHQ
jgi:hypothetical protein